MIRIKLDEVMFLKDRMKVPELSKLTGISRNTLYSIYNNDSTGIRFDILDKLCIALQCEPKDLIMFKPIDKLENKLKDDEK